MSPRPNRYNELVAAAAEEFRLHGYDKATIDGISQRLGILKGSVYNYIKTKEELLLAVIEGPADELLADAVRLSQQDGPAAERLRELFRTQVATFSKTYPAAFVYLHQLGSHPEQFRKRDRKYVAAVETIIADGIANDEFQVPVSPQIACRAVLGILNWMQHWFTPRGEQQDRELADQLYAVAVAGLMYADDVMSQTDAAAARADHSLT